MQVRLLGTVDVRVDGELRPVPGLLRKAILAVLALNAGQTVSTDLLIDRVWGDRAKGTAPNTLQSHVSYLRHRLGTRSAIIARPPGYLLDLPGDPSDAAAADRLIGSGLRATDPARRAEALRAALKLWRGRPLQEVLDVPWLAEQAQRLATLEFEARRALIEARLALGEHAQVVPELRLLAAQHPYDEQVQAQLVLALYRTGRQTDALAVLREVRTVLAADLGISPGRALRELEASVLRQDLALTSSPAPAGPPEGASAFVGRRAELARVTRLLDAAGSGPARLVEIVGDPGIGKTRLLTEVAAQARSRGWAVLVGRAAEFERQVPFGVIGDALSGHLGTVDSAASGVPDLDLLWAAVPGVAPAAAGSEPVGPERYRLYRAMRSLLTALAGTGGLVLILDDLHWADEGTVELTDFLLRHRPAGRVLIVVAHRPRQTPAALRRALARPDVAVVELGPLTVADADGLLPAGVDRMRRQRLYAASAGNPFYLLALAAQREPGELDLALAAQREPEELGLALAAQREPGELSLTLAAQREAEEFGSVRAVRREAGGAVPAAGAGAVPESVRAALAAEFAALTERQSLVAQGAAVAGDGVRAGLIARTAGLALDEVLADLDALARHDLIRAGAGGRFRFRHPLLRRVGYDLAGAGWRIAAHARAAAALRDGGATAAEIAVHIEHSAEPGDQAAVDVLRDAATAALQHSPAAAAHWLTAALRLVPDRAEDSLARLDLLTLQARAFGLSGRLRDSRAALHEIRRLIPAELAGQHAHLAAFCATIERLVGRHAEARAQLLAELRAQPDQHGDAALALKLGLATGVVIRADREPGPDWPAAALTTARRHGDRVATAWALAMCVVADHMAGRVDERTAARLAEAAQLVDAAPDGDVAERIESIMWLGAAETCQERLADAVRHLLRALAVTRAAGQGHGVAYVHAMLGAVHILLGDLTRAAAFLDDQLDAAYLTGSTELLSQAWRNQCWIALARGDAEEALRTGKEAVACADTEKHGVGGLAEGVLGMAHLLNGDPATCVELMVSGGGGPDLWRVDPFERSNWYEALAAAEAALGRVDAAAGWAGRAFANAAGLPRRTGLAHLARAHAVLTTDQQAAAAAATRGAELLRGAGDRLMAGRAHLLAGRILAGSGAAAAAREQFAAAGALFEECGAAGHLERTERERRAAGPSCQP